MLLPSRIHVIVLVSKLHTPTLRALAFARATRPHTLTALTVRTSPEETDRLMREWAERDIPVPLTVLDSSYRDVTRPVLEYIGQIRTREPRDVVAVFVPEYVVGHWWEQVLHNQSALRLKAGCCSSPVSWSPACRASWAPPRRRSRSRRRLDQEPPEPAAGAVAR